jgi:hypothetical protein
MWWSFHNRFSLNGKWSDQRCSFNGKNIWGNHQNGRIITLNNKNLSNFLLWLDATWHVKPHLGTLFGELELKALTMIIVPPQKRTKFCPNLPQKKTLLIYVSNNQVVYKCCEQILGYGYPFTRIMAIIWFSSFQVIVFHNNCLINIELLY